MVEPEESNLTSLISGYSSSSDEAPISTSRCADKEESSDDDSDEEKLPTPEGLNAAFPAQKRKMDDPSLHQGRKRKVKHVEGNFATRLYVPINLTLETPTPSGSINFKLQKECHELLQKFSDDKDQKCFSIETPHVTFSLTSPLRHHFIEPFLTAMAERLRDEKPFALSFDTSKLEIFKNESGDRFFAAVAVAVGKNPRLASVVNAVDEVASRFGTIFR